MEHWLNAIGVRGPTRTIVALIAGDFPLQRRPFVRLLLASLFLLLLVAKLTLQQHEAYCTWPQTVK